MFDFICEEDFLKNNFVKLIAIILGILTFTIERRLSFVKDKKTAKYDWFLKIIVQPNLSEIKKFYSDTHEELITAYKELLELSHSSSTEDYLVQCRKYCDTFKSNRRKFFNNFVSMVSAFDGQMALKVDEIINGLDDHYVTIIDFANADVDVEGMIGEIFANKALLYQTLFNDISK